MKILWFTWKDRKNPYAGGAEVVNEQLAKRLVAEGHEVIFLVRNFAGSAKEEMIDGYKVIRVGNYHTVYLEAYKYYKKNLVGWADLVIEGVNTIPFFCNWYVKEKNVLFFHQLCREIWFYEMRFPYNLVGYISEAIYLMLLGNREVITVSKSTKKDLNRFGFRHDKIKIISEGTEIEPVKELESLPLLNPAKPVCPEQNLTGLKAIKYKAPTVLSLGALRPMKRADQILEAFEIAKRDMPDLELIIAGDTFGIFGKKIIEMVETSPYKDSIQCLGRVSEEKKIELMRKSHLIAVTSVKEGWGLIVTEANSQGTPAVVYDIDGLRDSVRHGKTGLISEKNTPNHLAKRIIEMLSDKENYEKMRYNAWQWSKRINFEKSYDDFRELLDYYVEERKPSILKRVIKIGKIL